MEFYYDGEWYKVSVKAADTIPVGAIIEYPSLTAPYGYLLCDGRAVSRTEYADLFAVIGTSHGAGDGSTTFNLPTRKGRNAMGYDPDDSDFNTIGKTGGSKYLQAHSHEFGIPKMLYADTSSGAVLGGEAIVEQTIHNTGTTGTGDSGNLQPYQVSASYIKYTKSIGVLANTKNEATTSTEDAYACDYVNNELSNRYKAYTLYNNGNGTTDTVSLNDNPNNYSYIEIFYKTNDSGSIASQKIYDLWGGGNKASLSYIYYTSGSYYFKQANVTVSGADSKIYFSNNTQWGSSAPIEQGNFIYITRVVGYK